MQEEKLVFLNEKIAKKLFKNEKYGKILSAKVISDVIGADYDEVYNNLTLSSEEIAFSSLTINSTADAIYYNDVCYFDIELNFYNSYSKRKQLESYVYQLYLGQLHTFHDYKKLKKIIQISIDTYDRFNKGEFMYHVILMEEKYKIPYNNLINFVHINIDFLRKTPYTSIGNSDNKLMKDLYFLKSNNEERINTIYKEDEIMKEIVDEAKKIAGREKAFLYLTDEELFKQDQEYYYSKGLKEGIKEGIEQNKKDVILKMIKKEIPLETISDIVNLSADEIQKMISDNK